MDEQSRGKILIRQDIQANVFAVLKVLSTQCGTTMRVKLLFVAILSCTVLQAEAQRLRGRIRSSTFRRNMDDVTPGAATLAFVFDVTGSMWDDLQQVIAGAKSILDKTLQRQEKPLHDYVLVPFHDPVVGPITVTSDGDLFQRKLKELFVQGGGDCPEMSLTAIKESLEISLPSSFIYVFTDASAKDYDRLHDVLKIIQRKQSQVVFVLTGDCNNRNSPGYKAYEKIAATSSGQVFFITKDDVSEVVKFIEVSVQAHKVVLLATDHETGGDRTWEIPFDPELKEVTLSLSGPNRRLRVYNPDGRQITDRDGLKTLLSLDSVLILNIKNATKGIWRISAYSSGEHSLRITGLSTLDFQARFSRRPTMDWSSADFQPVEGAQTYMLLNATGLIPPGELREITLRDISGSDIQRVRFESPPDPSQPYLYVPSPYRTPEVDFYVYVFGVTHDNSPFQRATKNAILNIVPVAPSVSMQSSYPGYFDYPADIPCRVTSLIPFHVSWSRRVNGKWIPVGIKTLQQETTTVHLRIEEVTEEAEGFYRCVANNSRGFDYGETFLDVEERPPVITVDGNVTGAPGAKVVLTCHVTSNINYTVSWSRQEKRAFDASRARILQNNSLEITGLIPKDQGFYVCTATNSGGRVSGKILLTVQAAPVVSVRPKRPVKFVVGNTVYLRCVSSGYPQPTILWLNGSQAVEEDDHVIFRRRGTEIRFVKVQRYHEGIYTCQATNQAGTAADTGRLVYTELPTASIHDQSLLVQAGENLAITCLTTGVPNPRITWFLNYNQISNGKRHKIRDGVMDIYSVSSRDMGHYTCLASNEVGSANDSMVLEVGLVPTIVKFPVDTQISIGNTHRLQCEAVGHPSPDITWSKLVDSLEENGDDGFLGGFEIIIDKEEGEVYHDNFTNDLVINAMRVEDVGAYFCSATNPFGSDAKAVQITITGLVLPRIALLDPRPHVIIGQSVELPCEIISGRPMPTRQWNRHGQPYLAFNRSMVNGEGSIVILSAQVSDGGEYVCIATNEAGSYEAALDLDIWVPPSINTVEKHYSTNEGIPVLLECITDGNPKPAVEWRKSGQSRSLRGHPDYRIQDDNQLVIIDPNRSHSGTFICTATNDAGSATVPAHLEVFYKPEAIDGYKDVYSVVRGDSATLKCPVTESNPASTFSWSFQNSSISSADGRHILHQDGSLEMLLAEVSDHGIYMCTASNIAGSVSLQSMVHVYVPPVIRGPSSIKGLDGEDILISCEATGIPRPTIHWAQGGTEVTSGRRFSVSVLPGDGYSSSDVLISPAHLADDGIYICSATNLAGNAKHSISLDVQQRPSIWQRDPNPHLTPSKGTRLVIPCTARGDPAPFIRWYHGDTEILSGLPDVDIAPNGSLIIQSVDGEDSGLYTCEAENNLGIANSSTEVTVYEPPEISGSDAVTRIWVLEGESTEMYCPAKAVPKPIISWFKTGERSYQIYNDELGHFELLEDGAIFNITSARVSDTGNYHCTATNIEGTTKKFYKLEVYVLPSIDGSDEIGVHDVVLGDDFTLQCQTSGIPLPQIRWFKGPQEILPENENMHIDSNGRTLTVYNSNLQHAGGYTCFASNAVGEAMKKFLANIMIPPSIAGRDMTHAIPVGRYLSIECRASGVPTPKVNWYKNGRNIPVTNEDVPGLIRIRQNGKYLEFRSIRLENEGVYRCEAINDAGRATRTHTIDALVPPSFTDGSSASNMSVVEGDSVTLTCQVSGDPQPDIKWMKDGIPLVNGGRYQIHEEGDFLTISGAVPSDGAKYTCQASNNVGTIKRHQYIDVLVAPTIAGPNETSIKILKGEDMTLNCMAEGNPMPFISWERNGVPIEAGEHIEFDLENQRLILHNADEFDTGVYICTASNIIGSDFRSVRLTVQVPPQVLPFSQDVYEVIETENIQISCVAIGIPEPTVHWLKDGIALGKSHFFKQRERGKLLVILNANVLVHDGLYTCTASNEAGEDSRDTTVFVMVPPSIYGQKTMTIKDVEEGHEVALACRIKAGRPKPTIEWFYEDSSLDPDLHASWDYKVATESLTNARVKIDNTGAYSCEASNPAGRAAKKYQIEVQVRPFIDGDSVVRIYSVLHNNVTFTCDVSGIPAPNVTWTKNDTVISVSDMDKYEQRKEGSSIFELTLRSVEKDDEDVYSCIATNDAGEDHKDFTLSVFLPPSYNGSDEQNIIVFENDDTSLLCDVEAHPPPKIRWYFNARPVIMSEEVKQNLPDYRMLPIENAKLSDAGRYECEAENVAGITSKNFRLHVYSPPRVLGLNTLHIQKLVGDRINMLCEITGVPSPVLSWQKNGNPLREETGKLSISNGGKSLVITNAELDDQGQYECIGVSPAGKATKSFQASVHEPALILGASHENLNVDKGSSFELECLVTGSPKPKIVWFKDGRRVHRDNRHKTIDHNQRLQVKTSVESDAGRYYCNASNVEAYDIKSFTVDVLVPPIIDGGLSEKWVEESRNINLTCNVRSNSPVTMQWFYEENPIIPSSLVRLSPYGKKLMLFNVQTARAGIYTCVASNTAGSDNRDILLHVYTTPIIRGPPLLEVNVTKSHSISLECITVGFPKPSIEWEKDYSPLVLKSNASNGKYEIQGDGMMLTLHDANAFDAGSYRCKSTNEAGYAVKEHKLDVLVPPEIFREGSEDTIQAREGANIMLQCAATGNPPPEISWLKNGSSLEENEQLVVSNRFGDLMSIALIQSVMEADAGVYSCVAENDVGRDEFHTNVIVNVPPLIRGSDDLTPTSLEVPLGENVVLECQVIRGYPKPTLKWKKGSKNIVADDGIRISSGGRYLRISQINLDDSGIYTCVAENLEGLDSKEFNVFTLEAPKFDDDNKDEINVVRGFSQYLTCDIHARPQPRLEWLKDGNPIQLDGNHQNYYNGRILYVKHARLEDSGVYTCRASNKAGVDDQITKMNVLVPPNIVDDGSNEIDVVLHDPTFLNCSTYGIPQPRVSWYFNGIEIDFEDENLQTYNNDQILSIGSARLDDSGRYECYAVSSAGLDRKDFKVNVQVPPEISGPKYVEIIFLEGRHYELDCQSKGLPTAINEWYKDSNLIHQRSRYSIINRGLQLGIYNADERDGGIFLCEATNIAGSDRKIFNASVHMIPRLDDGGLPRVLIVNQHQNITMKCDSSTYPIPEVTWTVGTGDLPRMVDEGRVHVSEDGAHLTIFDVMPEDADEYRCELSNDAGIASRNFNLIVHQPPKIAGNEMEILEKTVESSILLECSTQGYPDPEIEWMKDGAPLVFSERTQLLPLGSSVRIDHAIESDKGEYSCIARNVAGEDRKEFLLDILVPPYIDDTIGNSNIQSIAGSEVAMACAVVEDNPPATVQWFKEDEKISKGDAETLESGRLLIMPQVQLKDAGKYTCVATNKVGQDQRHFNLLVFTPPQTGHGRFPNHVEVNETFTAVLHCDIIDGVPPSEITWTHNDEPIFISQRIKTFADGKRLEIYRTSVDNTGTYKCVASNIAGNAVDSIRLDVYVPPQFVNPDPVEVQTFEGESIDFDCAVVGEPYPTVAWTHSSDGGESHPLEEDNHFQISSTNNTAIIERAYLNDSGVYSCIATSIAGMAQKSFNVFIMAPPQIIGGSDDESIRAIEHEEFRLNCASYGIPPPTISWLKNGDALPVLDDSRIRNNGQELVVEDSQLSDIGSYECLVKSIAGTARKGFNVDVIVPPTSGNSFNITAVTGSNVQLDCLSDAIPPPDYAWLKDGYQLDHRGHILLLKNVRLTDAGSYVCEATNDAGTSIRKIGLTVYQKPTIAEGPSEVIALVHETVKFRCIADGVPDPTISWWKNLHQLSSNKSSRYRITGNSITISNLYLSDKGEYMCIVTNPAGSARRKISLVVHEAPTIARGPTNIIAIANSKVTLPCSASGTPNPVVTWTKDYEGYNPILNLGKRQDQTGSMHIESVSIKDSAIYVCTAENAAGSTSRTINLSVHVPPSILNSASSYIVEPFSRVSIPCKVKGVPKPKVTWNKEGVPVERLRNVFFNARDNSLDIPSVAELHGGSYTCVAINSAGRAEHPVDVKIQKTPRILETSGPVTALEGSNAALYCTAEGVPTPTITWKKGREILNGKDRIHQDNSGNINITDLEISDGGEYTCVAQNTAGFAFEDITLNVYTLPKIDVGFGSDMIAIAGQPFAFTMSASGIPSPEIAWTKDNSEIDFEDDTHYLKYTDGSLVIPIVLPSDEGIYNVSSTNIAGTTSAVSKLTVLVPPDVRTNASELVIKEGEQAILEITVSGKPLPVITWSKDGNRIKRVRNKIRQSPNGALTINRVTASDSGLYVVTAINDAGRSSSQIKVTVLVPPKFTETPEDQEKLSGDDLSFTCSAVGYPIPTISWKFNDKPTPGVDIFTNASGNSMLFIENVQRQDAGTYLCQASNIAGTINKEAQVSVDLPPVLIGANDKEVIARLGETARLDCPVTSDPPPVITWSKDGEEIKYDDRFQILSNGSLLVFDIHVKDAGQYKCTASNKAGNADVNTRLVLKLVPSFVIKPSDTVADAGTNVIFNCVASGRPLATIQWKKMSRRLPRNGRFTKLRNGSLLISTVQLEDTGKFQCIATNEIGSRMASASLTVQVHGRFGQWNKFGPCSATCGKGTQTRIRYCNSPSPANGGRQCEGRRENSRPCMQNPCPVNGNWGAFGPWELCSVTCGQGFEVRTRECNNPAPAHSGLPCNGNAFERRRCSAATCPVNGGWSSWNSWLPCSLTCGEGISVRTRSCTNPTPSADGDDCQGSATETKVCHRQNCAVNGNWGIWGPFSVCSVSCGGGTHSRVRTCTDPAPSSGGDLCPGSNVQMDNCNVEPCPVNGAWADWGSWSSCSATCGGGKRRRYRSCSDPRPRYGGKYCTGTDNDVQSCRLQQCPVDGEWSAWSEWTTCSITCGSGTNTRRRACNNPRPRNNGRYCEGNATQSKECSLQPCQIKPLTASGVLHGNVNGIPITDSAILSHAVDRDGKVTIFSVIKDIPREIGKDLRNQVSILTPIYWTFAKELEGAYNGYTLTEGQFQRQVNVEFPTGELVEMYHNAKGVTKDGNLDVDIQINGDVPTFPADIVLNIRDYNEAYVQTGLGSLYAHSDRFFTINGEVMLYTWTHDIDYLESRGVMPFLVEQLYGSNIIAEYDPELEELSFQIDVSITKADESDECPDGFVIDVTQKYCADVDECLIFQPCSHTCENIKGSYICECPSGFHLGMDGFTCEDIDECTESLYNCEAPFVCENSRGSYNCVLLCGTGLRRSEDGQSCIDINECESGSERICEQICHNTYGSFTCRCRPGYLPVDDFNCADVDECSRGACFGDAIQCHNTPGSYICTNSCPSGYEMNLRTDSCIDIDECSDPSRNHCEQLCENVEGSYRCLCRSGYIMNGYTGLCEDLDECKKGRGPCQFGCVNQEGSYVCFCPKGYRLTANGHSCEDINECLEGEAKCVGRDQLCANSLGDYRCVSTICPPGYKRKRGVCVRNCLRDECGNITKSVIRFNSTFLRVGVPQNQDLIGLAVSYTGADGNIIVHSNTTFRLMPPLTDKARSLFGLRVAEERGIIYTKTEILPQHIDWYRLRVAARSEEENGKTQFETIFSLYINVAPNPFL